jgi:flagellar motility protein MotE (MotC chaperone)
MATIPPSRKLLPATIAALAIMLAMKSAILARSAPGMDAMRAGVSTALAAAADMIPRAQAAAPEATPRDVARRGAAPATDRPSDARAAALPPASPPAAVAPAVVQPPAVQSAAIQPGAIQPGTLDAPSDVITQLPSQIEERERQVSQREAAVGAADKRLAERVAELVALQSRLQGLESALKQRDEANWAGMVKLYEGMHPRDAAAIFNDMDKPVLLEILDRMKPAKAAPVIAAMDVQKASQVTADLAARRTRSTTAN